jgi:hypothetical protein
VIHVHFDKAKAQRLLNQLRQGDPLQPPTARGWTGQDLLSLAGACFFAAFDHADALRRGTRSQPPLPRQPCANLDEAFAADLRAAIETLGRLAMMVADGDYDEGFAPHCSLVVGVKRGQRVLIPREGVKETQAEPTPPGAA